MTDTIDIPIGALCLDLENPRLTVTAANQRDALESIVALHADKLIKLACDIAELGLSPALRPLVVPDPAKAGNYVVVDGNRRLAALKLLTSPDELDLECLTPAQRRKLKGAAIEFARFKLRKVECVVYQTRAEAQPWIVRLHGNDQRGRGQEQWSALQNERAGRSFTGKGSLTLSLFEFLYKSSSMIDLGGVDVANPTWPFTNFQRLIQFHQVREQLGISIDTGTTIVTVPQIVLLRRLQRVAVAITKKELDSRTANKAEDAAKIIESLFQADPACNFGGDPCEPWPFGDGTSVHTAAATPVVLPANQAVDRSPSRGGTTIGGGAETSQSTSSIGSGTNAPSRAPGGRTQSPTPRAASASVRPPKPRKNITGTAELPIHIPKPLAMFGELKRLNGADYPIAAGILLRCFLETSLDEYASTYLSEADAKEFRRIALKNKVEKLRSGNPNWGNGQSDALKRLSGSSGNPALQLCVQQMHTWVHDSTGAPTLAELVEFWDSYQFMFEYVWRKIDGHRASIGLGSDATQQ